FQINAFLVINHAAGVRAGNNGSAELMSFFDGIDGNVTRTRYHYFFAFHGVAAGLQHFPGKEYGTVTGCLCARTATTPGKALAGEYARFVPVSNSFVLAKHIAKFTAAAANIAGRHVCILTQMTVKLGHQALAKTHDFVIRLALGVKVAAAFTATDRQTR